MAITPQSENISQDSATKTVYKYYDKDSNPIFKAKEIFKNQAKIILHPYYANKRNDNISQGKIKTVELVGWQRLEDLPNDFKKKYGPQTYYGLHSFRLKAITRTLSYKFKSLEKLVIGTTVNNRFSKKTISIKWDDLEKVLKKVNKEYRYYDKNKKLLINNELAKLTTKFNHKERSIHYGELKFFMDKFESFEKVSESDIESISSLFEHLPKSKISVTANFIKTKDKINIAYIEDILDEFDKHLGSKTDNEKAWQTFFEKHSWIFSHLFPYEVIFSEREAYVGGKTVQNKDGKIVDFLYQNGFQDNFALIEIKTHKKDILKGNAYRGADVFAMSDHLSGGINQCLDQKDNFIKDFGKDLKPIDPKCILVIGKKESLSKDQLKCFELLRHNQKAVDIVTFDELRNKIKGLLEVITN